MIVRTVAITALFSLIAFADSGGGLTWTVPSGWKPQASRPMRAATYSIPATAGDHDDAECAVYYFGQNQGGTVADNVARWITQFEGGEKTAKQSKRSVHGMNVTTLDVAGVYTGMGGPMVQAKTSKSGYHLLGAIVEGPQGLVFFKFTGPEKTISSNQIKFRALIDSVTR